jgi:hypothetical protein
VSSPGWSHRSGYVILCARLLSSDNRSTRSALPFVLDIAERMLKHTDEAIAITMEWVSKNPKDARQVAVVEPDQQGFWSAKGLGRGSYDIVIRGMVSRLDADGRCHSIWGRKVDIPFTRFSRDSFVRFLENCLEWCPLWRKKP